MKESLISYKNKILQFKSWLAEAEVVIVGAGAGLSTSAGFTYSGERFKRYFSDFSEKYHFNDMYAGGFYPFPSQEEFWAYWSRYIMINRYQNALLPVYEELLFLVKNKNYFVITTNVDHCFQKAGFDKKRLFYTQGDYGLFQCPTPCHNKTYDNEEVIKKMFQTQSFMRVPTSLIPHCPLCGMPMTMNLRADNHFVEDEGWWDACRRYEEFLKENKNKKILYLELGVGMNTPVIIKYPFWQFTMLNSKAKYITINKEISYIPEEIKNQSIAFKEDIYMVLKEILN